MQQSKRIPACLADEAIEANKELQKNFTIAFEQIMKIKQKEIIEIVNGIFDRINQVIAPKELTPSFFNEINKENRKQEYISLLQRMKVFIKNIEGFVGKFERDLNELLNKNNKSQPVHGKIVKVQDKDFKLPVLNQSVQNFQQKFAQSLFQKNPFNQALQLMKHLDNSKFEHVQNTWINPKFIYFESIQGFNLLALIKSQIKISASSILSILIQVALGIQELYDLSVVEANLTPEKIILEADVFKNSESFKVKICRILQILPNQQLKALNKIYATDFHYISSYYHCSFLLTQDINDAIWSFLRLMQYVLCKEVSHEQLNIKMPQKELPSITLKTKDEFIIKEATVKKEYEEQLGGMVKDLISKFNSQNLQLSVLVTALQKEYFKNQFLEKQVRLKLNYLDEMTTLKCDLHKLTLKSQVNKKWLCKKCLQIYADRPINIQQKIQQVFQTIETTFVWKFSFKFFRIQNLMENNDKELFEFIEGFLNLAEISPRVE